MGAVAASSESPCWWTSSCAQYGSRLMRVGSRVAGGTAAIAVMTAVGVAVGALLRSQIVAVGVLLVYLFAIVRTSIRPDITNGYRQYLHDLPARRPGYAAWTFRCRRSVSGPRWRRTPEVVVVLC